ncbi:putative major facilitator superfamily transporter [Aureobasidium namibiae CBS 147.97]|uniref:Putative major facilitator superfamily transporter n=1 Tax=Aureobasidium namibiae CBS 147.97 TaxID=1043004 RepID=A0A074XC17_9PEZI|nr:putative major facilitator superfamily transporter [Aureobasidium namibiae CBS 147.97]KEQ72136.1 putative major facilitator superfamily transporter [Aureobasidium namibiae CBS 147.97]
MGLFKNKTIGGPHTVPQEEHEGGVDSMSKAEAVTAVREESVDKDAASKAEGDTDAASRVAEDESKYPTGPKLWLLVLGLCLAIWVVALDNSIIATAIPKITTEWPDALNDVGWIGSSYLLTTTSLQPSFGKVYTYFDVKWTYLSALIIFEVGSVICAAASSSTMLIVGRAIAGVGAAALFSGGMTIIGFIAPLRKRAIYIASLSSMFGIASIVGPLLGGVFTDHATWRWCFWINLPFGGIGLVAVFFFFENPERRHTNMTTKEKLKQIDLLGAFLLICAIVCLLLALQWGGTTYPWSNSKVWGCLLGFGLLISIFIALQIKLGDRATLPPRILVKNRTVLVSALYSTFFAMGLYTHIFYLPFYFQAVKNTSAEGSGIRCIAYLCSNTIASIIVGGTITVIGVYAPFMWFGAAVFTVGAGMLYTLEVASPAAKWIGYQLLAGIGSGSAIQIPFIAVQVVLEEKDMPSGNAIAIFFNSLGGAISISIAQNIFANTLVKDIIKDAPGVNPAAVISAGATHVRDVVSAAQLPGVLTAYSNAVTTAFIVPIVTSGLAFVVSLFIEWKSIKGKNIMGGGAA